MECEHQPISHIYIYIYIYMIFYYIYTYDYDSYVDFDYLNKRLSELIFRNMTEDMMI